MKTQKYALQGQIKFNSQIDKRRTLKGISKSKGVSYKLTPKEHETDFVGKVKEVC